jgi:hypothetical protein
VLEKLARASFKGQPLRDGPQWGGEDITRPNLIAAATVPLGKSRVIYYSCLSVCLSVWELSLEAAGGVRTVLYAPVNTY